jgi:hypothetical protein
MPTRSEPRGAHEALVPARLLVDDAAFDCIVEWIEHPPPSTDALRELMRGIRRRGPA